MHPYEGTVNQVTGDAIIIALLGAPLVHEDHAVRAYYAVGAFLAQAGKTPRVRRRLTGRRAGRTV